MKRSIAAGLVLSFGLAAAANAVTLLSEGFDDVAALPGAGWTLTNSSTPVGSTGWFQGVPEIFAAQSGEAGSYIAANYLNAGAGGTIANTLTSPTFSTATEVTVSFYARAEVVEPWFDQIAFGSGTLGAPVTLTDNWTQYSFTIPAAGAGSTASFTIKYLGLADDSNYIGIDSVVVSTVPEAAPWMMLGLGLACVSGLALRRRSPV